MLAYIPYMDPMGYTSQCLMKSGSFSHSYALLHCTERLLAGRSTPTEAAGCTALQIRTPMLSWARVWPRPSMAGAMMVPSCYLT